MSHKVASVCITFSLTGMLLLSACGGSATNSSAEGSSSEAAAADSASSSPSSTSAATASSSVSRSSSSSPSTPSKSSGGSSSSTTNSPGIANYESGFYNYTYRVNEEDGSWSKETGSIKVEVFADGSWQFTDSSETQNPIISARPDGSWTLQLQGNRMVVEANGESRTEATNGRPFGLFQIPASPTHPSGAEFKKAVTPVTLVTPKKQNSG